MQSETIFLLQYSNKNRVFIQAANYVPVSLVTDMTACPGNVEQKEIRQKRDIIRVSECHCCMKYEKTVSEVQITFPPRAGTEEQKKTCPGIGTLD